MINRFLLLRHKLQGLVMKKLFHIRTSSVGILSLTATRAKKEALRIAFVCQISIAGKLMGKLFMRKKMKLLTEKELLML